MGHRIKAVVDLKLRPSPYQGCEHFSIVKVLSSTVFLFFRMGAAQFVAPGLDKVRAAWEERNRAHDAILHAQANR